MQKLKGQGFEQGGQNSCTKHRIGTLATGTDDSHARTFSDFTHSGLTLGKHPIAFHRDQLRAMGVLDNDLVKKQRDGAIIQIAGLVITRQRPGTAKGFVFLTLEDETGVLNLIVNPGLYDRERITIGERYLLIKGVLDMRGKKRWNTEH